MVALTHRTPCSEKAEYSKNLLNLMGKNRDNLSATLTEEQKETLAKYDDCVNEMYGIIEREIFAYGFRLGGRLMMETLTDSLGTEI